MSFPFGSGMPQPQGNNPQQPYPNNPYPQHGAQPPPPHAFGAGFPPPGNAAPFAPYPPQQQQHYGAPPPTFGGAGAPYPPQGHTAPYQQSPQHHHHHHQQAYPAGPIGGVPVYPPQQQQQAHYNPGYPNQQQPPHGGPHYNAPHGGFNSAYGQQSPPNAYNQHQQQSAAAAAQQPKGTPTIRPVPNFNAADDAKALRKAMKGFGTDEDALIAVLCHRSNDQIQQIKQTYKTSFGRDLLEDVRSETSGKFETVLCALLLPRLDYYAKELNDAMAGIGTDEDALVEILCSLSNYEIQAIRAHYKQVYYKDLESELMSETSGHFKRLLVSMVTAGRDESGRVDVAEAQQDATALLRAGELRAGTDESTFNMVLCQRNYAQIRAICAEYQRLTGHSLQKAIEKEFSGDICDGLVAVVQCMTNKAEFFATRLHKSMAGLGTTDSQLVRVLVMRAEVDLADVKVAFERLYGKSLRDWIKGDTSGHYKHALYHLIGETPSS